MKFTNVRTVEEADALLKRDIETAHKRHSERLAIIAARAGNNLPATSTTALRNAAIVNLRKNGAIYKDIAAKFGITTNRARQIAIRGGCDLVIACPANNDIPPSERGSARRAMEIPDVE